MDYAIYLAWSWIKAKDKDFSTRRGCSYWWRDLRKIYHNAGQSIFQQNLAWKIGGGDRIHFWTDRWLGEDCTLKQKYNSLFLINRQQHSTISQMGNFSEDGWSWDLNWRRNLFDHESVLAVNFMEDISSNSIQKNVKDTMVWKVESTGVYSTSSAYRLMLNINASASTVRIFKLIWNMNIPPRAAIFTWRLLKDRLPTKGNLLRRNVITQDADCPLCGQVQEEAGHLFFNCQRTLPLWWESMSWLQVLGPLPLAPASHITQFCEGFRANVNHSRWYGWWVALTNTIWQHRNNLIFQGNQFDSSKVMEEAMFSAWSWLKAREKGFNTSFNHYTRGSPGSFKWEGVQGSFTPLTSVKRISQKKDYDIALVGAFRREKDKEMELQALRDEIQASMKLMRLRFREAGIKRLETVASEKISAETHLLKEKEEHLKEIESFCMEGERERMSEQVMVLENKLLEALDWKFMHETDLKKNSDLMIEDVHNDGNLISKQPLGWGGYALKCKLQNLKHKLKSWSRDICGDLGSKVKQTQNRSLQGRHSIFYMYRRLNAPRHFGNDNRNYLPSSVFMEQTPYEISAHGSSRLHPTALFNSKMMIRSSSGWDKDLYNCQSYQRSFCSPNLTGHAKFDAETVANMGIFGENGWEWKFSWRRHLFDSELGEATAFIDQTSAISPVADLKDDWVWGAQPTGMFSTNSAYNCLRSEQPLHQPNSGFRQLWEIKIPPAALSFAWRLLWDRLPSKDNLISRQIVLQNDLCPFCQSQVESASHLFFTCYKVMPLWWEFNSWVKEDRVLHSKPMDNFLQHCSLAGSRNSNRRRKIWWIAATKSIWSLRNDMVFNNQSFDISKLMDRSIYLTWSWLRGWEKDFTNSYGGGKPDSRKIAWISWSQCCSPKHMGGLEIRDLPSLNKALLFKWKWLMFHQPDQLWTRILISMYNGWRGLEYGPRKQYFSTWWADLRAIFQQQNVVSADNQIRWKLGRGDKFLFWEDPWGDEGVPLKDQFHELFSISSQRDLRVAEVGSWTENGWVWNMVWRRHLFDNEVQLASIFIYHIHQIRVNNNLNDTWLLNLRWYIQGLYLGFKKLWEIKLPPKALSFVWRLLWDRLPTKDNLIKRQIQVDNDLCPFCHNQPESASHLFFTCGKTMAIWWEYLSWVKEDKVFHCRPLDNFIQHYSSATSKVSNTRRTMWWIAATV
ncbi:Kinesin-like protein KIN-12E [Glycine max]|nr:Kinesin-like protein KIN-12E [Glycine max]